MKQESDRHTGSEVCRLTNLRICYQFFYQSHLLEMFIKATMPRDKGYSILKSILSLKKYFIRHKYNMLEPNIIFKGLIFNIIYWTLI
jgi:hypothetical protein